MQFHDGRKLPPGWVKCLSTKYGREYFFDTQTGESAWFAPAAAQTLATTTPQHQHQHQQLHQEVQVDEGKEPFSPPTKRSRHHESSQPPPPPPLPQEGTNIKKVIAVIVPYRDLDPKQRRSAHLARFVPYMEDFLTKAVGGAVSRAAAGAAAGAGESAEEFRVYVVEQSADGRKFNRGKLLNIGFDLARRDGCGAFLFHDVDLLPSDELGR